MFFFLAHHKAGLRLYIQTINVRHVSWLRRVAHCTARFCHIQYKTYHVCKTHCDLSQEQKTKENECREIGRQTRNEAIHVLILIRFREWLIKYNNYFLSDDIARSYKVNCSLSRARLFFISAFFLLMLFCTTHIIENKLIFILEILSSLRCSRRFGSLSFALRMLLIWLEASISSRCSQIQVH